MNLLTRPSRRTWLATVAALSGCLMLPAQAQTPFPNKQIRVIVPLPAGGIADASMRVVAEQMQAQMKQTVIVENKPGGAFMLGMQGVLQAPADGYTLIHLNLGMVAVQATHQKYELLKQLAPIGLMGETPAALVVKADAPWRSMQELVAHGRANPGKLNIVTAGPGGSEHLKAVELEQAAGFKATMIPTKGGPDMAMSILQGETQATVIAVPVAAPFVQKGQMRMLAVMTDKRLPAFPDVPTMAEAGIKLTPLLLWGGLAAPAGTPAAVVAQLQRELATAVNTPAVADKLRAMGVTPIVSASPEEFAKLMQRDQGWTGAAVKAANIKLD